MSWRARTEGSLKRAARDEVSLPRSHHSPRKHSRLTRRPAHKSRSTQVLNSPDRDGDLRAPEVDAFEAVQVRGAGGHALLKLVRVDDHGDCETRSGGFSSGTREQQRARQGRTGGVGVVGGVLGRSEGNQDLASLVDLAVTNEPPGRLRGKDAADENRDRPNPLRTVRQESAPFQALDDGKKEGVAGREREGTRPTWIAYGMRYPHSVLFERRPRRTPAATS